ncbi:MAG: L-dopachrome tautomerase-related protein [Myxococcota bacterium]|jgi:sugar lactone lactonase YvrE|nr:L-dopachrome tautomerase-related protein [Myxococcota bacterium]
MNHIKWTLALSLLLTACSTPSKQTDEAPKEASVNATEDDTSQTPAMKVKVIAESKNQWTGVAAVGARVYVNFPRWSDNVPISVGYLDGEEVLPFPDASWQTWQPGEDFSQKFVAVQSVVPGPAGNVWVLDTGNPGFQGVIEGAARLFLFDAEGNKLDEIPFGDSTKPNSYTNDIRFDLEKKRAYVTDSGAGGLFVIDLETKAIHRALDGHPSVMAEDITITIDGTPWLRGDKSPRIHADGIALHDGWLYYQALTGRTLYRIPTEALEASKDEAARTSAIETLAEVGPSDGLIAGPDGSIYLSSLESNAVRAYRPDGTIDVIAQDASIAWPDSFTWTAEGNLLVTASRIHQGSNPKGPYSIIEIAPE